MVLKSNEVLRQNVKNAAVPSESYQFRFLAKITGVEYLDLRITMRLRYVHKKGSNPKDKRAPSPCRRSVCNIKRILYNGRLYSSPSKTDPPGTWQEIGSERFDMFKSETDKYFGKEGHSYAEWSAMGRIDYILFNLLAKDMASEGELRVADFAIIGENYFAHRTLSPSTSSAPSMFPTNLHESSVGYVLRYAGEIRTVIRYPFQVDGTGEILPMDGSLDYRLCLADEVEGRKVGFPNRMSFWYKKKCVAVRHGNPTVSFMGG